MQSCSFSPPFAVMRLAACIQLAAGKEPSSTIERICTALALLWQQPRKPSRHLDEAYCFI